MSRRTLLIFGLALFPSCAAATGALEGPRGFGRFGGFYANLGGDVFTSSGGKSGRIDVDSSGQGDQDLSPWAHARFGLGPLDLTLSFFQYGQAGTGLFAGNFLGVSFAGPVRGEIDIQDIKAILGWNFVDTELVRVALLAGVNVYSVDLALTDLLTGTQSRLDETAPIPVVGVRGEVEPLPALTLAAGISGFSISISDNKITLIDFQSGIYYEVIDHVEVFLGYRYIDSDFSGTTSGGASFNTDLSLTGPFFGVGATF